MFSYSPPLLPILLLPPAPAQVFPTADRSLQPGQGASTPTLLRHCLLRCPLHRRRYLPAACGEPRRLFLHCPSSSSSSTWPSRQPQLPSRSPRGCFTRLPLQWPRPSLLPPQPVSNRSWNEDSPWALAPSQMALSCLLPHLPLPCLSPVHGPLLPVHQAHRLCRPSPQQEPWPCRHPIRFTRWGPRGTTQPICRPSATPAVSCWKPSEKVGKHPVQ